MQQNHRKKEQCLRLSSATLEAEISLLKNDLCLPQAAFMCGREPNFELSEEEKQELRKFKWDEFLVVTRSAISNKKHQRRNGGLRRKVEPSQNSDWDADHGGFSGSED